MLLPTESFNNVLSTKQFPSHKMELSAAFLAYYYSQII